MPSPLPPSVRTVRAARYARQAIVGLLAIALLTSGLAPASADTNLPAVDTMVVGGQDCGTEPVVLDLTSDEFQGVAYAVTLDMNEAAGVHVEIVRPDGSYQVNRRLSPFPDGRFAGQFNVSWPKVVEGARYTYRAWTTGADGSEGTARECTFTFSKGPEAPFVAPVLSEPAYFADDRLGGLGARGSWVLAPSSPDEGLSAFDWDVLLEGAVVTGGRESLNAAGLAVVPYTPTKAGSYELRVAGVDADGTAGRYARLSFVLQTGAAGEPPIPQVTLGGNPAGGKLPLAVVVPAVRNHPNPLPGSTLVLTVAGTELARLTPTASYEQVLVDQRLLTPGMNDVRLEYTQFTGAKPLTVTTKVCGGACEFSGGSATVSGDLDVAYRGHGLRYRASTRGFSPTPTTLSYQWFRDGRAVTGATRSEYIALPPDWGHRLSVRVTARGLGMKARTVTSPARAVKQGAIHVLYGGKTVGSRWEKNFSYEPFDDGDVASWTTPLEMLSVTPLASNPYITSSDGAAEDVAMWFDMRGYVQGKGWTRTAGRDGVYYVGTVGERRRLQAVTIDPGGPWAKYFDVHYRVAVPGRGWLGWATNGQVAGTVGYGSGITGVQVRMLPKGKKPGASASGNAASYVRSTQQQVRVEAMMQPAKSWRSAVGGGTTAGKAERLGAPKRLNAIRVDLDGRYSGGIQVSARVKGDGWRPWVRNDRIAGATRLDRPTSAYRMRLTGKAAENYRLYYRTYVQGVGWLGWAHDGAASGTASYKSRPTAVQVLLVAKGEPAPRSGNGRAPYRR